MKAELSECPMCYKDDLQNEEIFLEESVAIKVQCQLCGYEWWEVYQFSHHEDMEGFSIDERGVRKYV